MSYTTLGELIRSERAQKGMTQQRLADLADVTHTYISHIENGRVPSPPSERTLIKIADALELDVNDVLQVAGRIDWSIIQQKARENPTLAKFLRALPYYSEDEIDELRLLLESDD